MLLILDIGNTRTQYSLYEGAELLQLGVLDALESMELEKFNREYDPQEIFFADVRGGSLEMITRIFPKAKILSLDSEKLEFPFENAYKTPETLGADRKALVAAAYFKYPQANCLILDIGTCITYDFLDEHGVYRGGAISPGIRLRYKVLHEQTGKLPLLELNPISKLTGSSTEEAIHSGVYNGVLAEIKNQIDQYVEKHHNLIIILTGGDVPVLSKSIKKPIFAEPNFLLEGMFTLLEYNKNS